ncbi:hypothetical protein [Cacatuid alphaherpesvirus 2]|uniref:Uncharacterized protein n=1 Tax=Cacatuid alphaherpesvirus 2 TaxID=2604840 RepID=A0A5B9QZY8_9ALPH|nr:hypothetical protein QKT46_gp17 [Cacatuid alphaherpesvirus 2]QEG54078.1 hypothetical protein [Cacatuid alphaherpesvirus 2]
MHAQNKHGKRKDSLKKHRRANKNNDSVSRDRSVSNQSALASVLDRLRASLRRLSWVGRSVNTNIQEPVSRLTADVEGCSTSNEPEPKTQTSGLDSSGSKTSSSASSGKLIDRLERDCDLDGDLGLGKRLQPVTETTPCWFYKDEKKRRRVGVIPELLPEIFEMTEAEALGLLRDGREKQILLAAGRDAVLVDVEERVIKKNKTSRDGGCCSRNVSCCEDDNKNTEPVIFRATCWCAPVRLGLFNAPFPLGTKLRGEHYFVPYLRLMPQTFTRSETLSLTLSTEAAALAGLLWNATYQDKFNEDVFYCPAVMFSSVGTQPDFTSTGKKYIVDSPFCYASFLPGILVILPQHDIPLDVMQRAVNVARRAIESSEAK